MSYATPPLVDNPKLSEKKVRNSNLELYRIIVMLLIVAHHYVVNSGLMDVIGESEFSIVPISMLLLGAWGKTGINCFMLITGYFMCKSNITGKKLLKLYLQIVFYAVIIYGIFCITGHEKLSVLIASFKLFPVKSITNGFTSCFLLFYLFIPFLNILIHSMNRRQHGALIILALTVYTLLPSVGMKISFNYISWFSVLYLIAAYIRIYDIKLKISHNAWGWLTLILIVLASISVVVMFWLHKSGYIGFHPYIFITDSNKLLALAIGLTSFMWFKDIRIPYSRIINAIGATTFGVLLVHANSDAMRQWLWKEAVDVTGHFGDSLLMTLGYALGMIAIIFVVCSGIDWFRGKLIEPMLLRGMERINLHRHRLHKR